MDTAVLNALQSARLLSPNISEAQLLAMASNLMKMNQQVNDVQESLFGTPLPTTNLLKAEPVPNSPSQNGLSGNNTPSAGAGNGIKSYPCSVCQKVFWSQDQLSKHMTIHPTVDTTRMFTCEICNKSFRFRSNLAEHRSVHTSLKPYVCKYCGKSSRLKGNLTKHILKHHKQEQNAFIGKDDIIIKKGKKCIKDPLAIDFLERSMLILGEHDRRPLPINIQAPKQSVSITTSVLANGASAPLNATPDSGDRSGSAGSLALNGWGDDSSMMDQSGANDDSVLHTTNVPSFMPLGAGNGLADKCLLLNSAAAASANGLAAKTSDDGISMSGDEATPDSELPVETTSTPNPGTSPSEPGSMDSPAQSRTPNTMMGSESGMDLGARCRLCQKHFRKRRNLGIHMTLKHGFPPQPDDFSDQSSIATTNDTQSICDGVKAEPQDLPEAQKPQIPPVQAQPQAVQQQQQLNALKAQLKLQQQQQQLPNHLPNGNAHGNNARREEAKLENLLAEQDTRLCRLEKQVETVLATMYTLVQLQTGMNQTLQRFKEDTNRQMQHFTQLINASLEKPEPVIPAPDESMQEALETPESVAPEPEEEAPEQTPATTGGEKADE